MSALSAHTMDECLTWEWVLHMSPVSVASGLRPRPGSAGSELTEPSQTLHTHVYMGPCELCISKTFPTCLLCVTLSLSGSFRVRKDPPFLLVLCWKWRAAGGCHHPDNAAPQCPPLWPSPGATPSTAPPWWWGLHTHTHTHKMKLSRLIQWAAKVTLTRPYPTLWQHRLCLARPATASPQNCFKQQWANRAKRK